MNEVICEEHYTEGKGVSYTRKGELIRCKDCRFFEYDHFENVYGIPLIVAHEICMRLSDGVKVIEDGFCFLGERKREDDNGR